MVWFPDRHRDFGEVGLVLTDDILAIVYDPLYGVIKMMVYGQAG